MSAPARAWIDLIPHLRQFGPVISVDLPGTMAGHTGASYRRGPCADLDARFVTAFVRQPRLEACCTAGRWVAWWRLRPQGRCPRRLEESSWWHRRGRGTGYHRSRRSGRRRWDASPSPPARPRYASCYDWPASAYWTPSEPRSTMRAPSQAPAPAWSAETRAESLNAPAALGPGAAASSAVLPGAGLRPPLTNRWHAGIRAKSPTNRPR